MESNKVKVDIYGQTYTIRGDASPDYIADLAAYVDAKMEEIGATLASANPLQVAILAALNIADEFYQMKNLKVGIEGALEEKAKVLISMLDEGLIGDIFSRARDTGRAVKFDM